jgi:hypothetical protein
MNETETTPPPDTEMESAMENGELYLNNLLEQKIKPFFAENLPSFYKNLAIRIKTSQAMAAINEKSAKENLRWLLTESDAAKKLTRK